MALFWALAAQAILSISRLLTSITVNGRFGPGSPAELGYYASAFGLLMLLVGIHEAFVTTPLTVFNQRHGDEEKRRFFSGSMLLGSMSLGFLITTVCIAFLWVPFLNRLLKPELAATFGVLLAVIPLQLLREFSRRWLLANLKICASAWLEFFFAGIYIVALGGLVWFSNVSAMSVLWTLAIVNVIGLSVFWFFYRSDFRFSKTDAKVRLGENFRYGRWVAGENICSTVTMYFIIWMLVARIDETASGIFSACLTMIMLANPFLLGVCSILAPRSARAFTENGWSGLVQISIQYALLMIGVLGVFSAGMWIYGGQLTELFFGDDLRAYFDANYNGQNDVTRILGISMPFLGISFVLACALLAANRPYDSFYSAAIGLVVLIVANFSVSVLTLNTAAVSFLLAFIANAVARLFFLARAYRKSGSLPHANELAPADA